jgi:fumarate reductase subunit C
MSRHKPAAKTYVRPMPWWWTRNAYFARYMLREGSAVFLTGYALMVLAGLLCLAWGPDAYAAWRGLLDTPLSLGLHALALLAALYHSLTWFQVMPKTAPDLPIAPRQIVRGGLVTSAILSVLILAALFWVTR